jgi:hypothetical protein
MSDANCTQTKVRNMSGGEAFFGFLPPHGKRLASGEEYSYFGSPETLFASVTKKRHRTALQNALVDGKIVIVSTPSVIAYDETKDVSKAIGVSNNSVVASDPCWGAYSSSITDPHTV